MAYAGPLNDLIYQLAEHEVLKKQLKIRGTKSSAFATMLDGEYVLRFLTLSESWKTFSGDLRRSMDDFMHAHRFANENEIAEFRERFTVAIEGCWSIWGERAFQRPAGSGWRAQALAGMYDAQMIAVAELSGPQREALYGRGPEATKAVRRLFQDRDFDSAVRQATNTPSRVRHRVRAISQALIDLLNED